MTKEELLIQLLEDAIDECENTADYCDKHEMSAACWYNRGIADGIRAAIYNYKNYSKEND